MSRPSTRISISARTEIIINTNYFKTTSGLLKLGELILGAVCVGLVADYFNVYIFGCKDYRFDGNAPVTFFLLISTTFMIGTFCLTLSCLISVATSSTVSNPIFEVVYHIVAFVLYLTAAFTLLLVMIDQTKYNYFHYNTYLAASIIGLVVASLYFFSTIIAIRSYRKM